MLSVSKKKSSSSWKTYRELMLVKLSSKKWMKRALEIYPYDSKDNVNPALKERG